MVLSESGQAAAVVVAVAVALEEVLEAAAFALVPEAVTKPEAEEIAEEEDEEPVFDDETDETAALSPRLTRAPERWLPSDETGLPICVFNQQAPDPAPDLPPT
jgi:hypothetical protein